MKLAVHSCIREYHRRVPGFAGFFKHPIRSVVISPHALSIEGTFGEIDFFTDTIQIRAAPRMSVWEASGHATNISHEIAHHVIEEFLNSRREGVNLVHFWSNAIKSGQSISYDYTRRYWTPTFFFRYGLPWLSIHFASVKDLVEDRAALARAVADGSAPQGVDAYW